MRENLAHKIRRLLAQELIVQVENKLKYGLGLSTLYAKMEVILQQVVYSKWDIYKIIVKNSALVIKHLLLHFILVLIC